MCWICNHPGATERDYTEHMRRLITAYGWAVQGVERDGIHPPWALAGSSRRAGAGSVSSLPRGGRQAGPAVLAAVGARSVPEPLLESMFTRTSMQIIFAI